MSQYTTTNSTPILGQPHRLHSTSNRLSTDNSLGADSAISTAYPNVVQRRMSVVNFEAAIGVNNSFSNQKVSRMSLAYRFRTATRSSISSSLGMSSSALLGQYMR